MTDSEVSNQNYNIDFERIKELISKYEQIKKSGEIKRYNEESTKKDFILPLFEALGWNVYNRGKRNDSISAEETISKRRVDYGFRINGIPKFFLEAKSLKEENIHNNRKYVTQAIDYAWMKSCSWAILTNFETIAVYNADWKESNYRNNLFFVLHSSDFLNDSRFLLLSKKAFENEEIDKIALKYGKKQFKNPINKQLLLDMIHFREILSRNIVKNNQDKHLTQEDIDESVQRILDRLIFIRNTEDRGLEENQLLSNVRQWSLKGKGNLIKEISNVYKYYDDQYNSKLFDHHLCDDLYIDNEALQEVIEGLNHSKDNSYRYDFSIIESDVLGNMYEQYLGNILKSTPKKAKLEQSKAHRKKQGIYYTPSYIVDYIVKNTVGEYIRTHTPEEIKKVRILDPACGSGSFLIRAYKELENYWKQNSDFAQLTLDSEEFYSKKVEILKNNIFGVDLDSKAVEIAQLNLLLQISEKGEKLPILQNNIKVGNSLIDDLSITDKAFKWEEEFEEIMKEGGFDVVIGNPPYFTMQSTGEKIQKYFSSSDRWKSVYRGESDILYYFIIQGLKLLKEHGFLGFITSRYWLENKWADKLRDFILKNAKIIEIIDFRDYYVFSDSDIHTCIIILQKETNLAKRIKNQINVKIFSESNTQNILDFLNKSSFNKISQNILSGDPWILDTRQNITLKMEKNSFPLGHLCFVSKGMDTGLNKAFIVDKEIIRMNKLENAILKRVIKNSDIKRYFLKDSGLYLIYTTDEININDYPNVKKWLESFKTELTNRWSYRKGDCSWFRLSTLRSKSLFDNSKEKIFTPYRATKNTFALDTNKFYGMTDTTIIVKRNEKINHLYLLGLLNSKLMNFYVLVTGKKKGTSYEYFADYLKKLPIRVVPESKQQHIIELVDKMLYLNERLNEINDKNTNKKAKIEEEIKKTDAKIDELVYQIYGITEEEKKFIEESLKKR